MPWYWVGGVLGGILVLGLVILGCFCWLGQTKRKGTEGNEPRELEQVVVVNNETYSGPAVPDQVGTQVQGTPITSNGRGRGGCIARSVDDITKDHVYESAKRTPKKTPIYARVLRDTPARRARAARALPTTPVFPSRSLPNLMEMTPLPNSPNLDPIVLEFDPFETSETFPFVRRH